jgi:hypothetical protein
VTGIVERTPALKVNALILSFTADTKMNPFHRIGVV